MSKTRKATCLDDLRMRILTLDLAPGADLDEATLSAAYAISRTPLREILRRLAGDGFAVIEDNRGARVASMDISTMRTFFQTAPLIYASIARLAAENRSVLQLDRLREVQAQFAAAVAEERPSDAAMANHAFHDLIGQMAQNPYLTAALDRLLIDHTRLSQTFYRPASDAERALVATACEQHEGMIAAIDARKPARVVELALQHWDLSRDRLQRFVRPDPLPLEVQRSMERQHAV